MVNFHWKKLDSGNLRDEISKYFMSTLFSDHPILQILESRTTDKLAIDFVKKQKLRFAEQ